MTEPQEDIRPCPVPRCGGTCSVTKAFPPQSDSVVYYVVRCDKFCGYCWQLLDTEGEAIASHNELCDRLKVPESLEVAVDECLATFIDPCETSDATIDLMHKAFTERVASLLAEKDKDIATITAGFEALDKQKSALKDTIKELEGIIDGFTKHVVESQESTNDS